MNIDEVIDELRISSLAKSKEVGSWKKRFVFKELSESIQKKPRIKLVKGFRGVGKTTLLLQLFSLFKDKAFYLSADSPILKKTTIYFLGKELIKKGYTLLLIDEIHTYLKWKEELKALNDEYPSVVIIASGSAPLAFIPERREELIEVSPLSFSEYLFLKKSVEIHSTKEWQSPEKTIDLIAAHSLEEGEFSNYFNFGGFPFFLELEKEKTLNAIYYSMNKSVREDAVFFLKMSKEKIFAMEKLLVLLATSSPGELSLTSLSSSLEVSKSSIYEIINALSSMQLIRIIRPYKKGASLVRGEPKILFFHPNLRTALCHQLGLTANIGSIREELALFAFTQRDWKTHTIKGMKKSPDYVIEKEKQKFVIEIGGDSKTKTQLKGFANALVLNERQLISLSLI